MFVQGHVVLVRKVEAAHFLQDNALHTLLVLLLHLHGHSDLLLQRHLFQDTRIRHQPIITLVPLQCV